MATALQPLTRSLPLTQPVGLRLRQIHFAASQAAQVPGLMSLAPLGQISFQLRQISALQFGFASFRVVRVLRGLTSHLCVSTDK